MGKQQKMTGTCISLSTSMDSIDHALKNLTLEKETNKELFEDSDGYVTCDDCTDDKSLHHEKGQHLLFVPSVKTKSDSTNTDETALHPHIHKSVRHQEKDKNKYIARSKRQHNSFKSSRKLVKRPEVFFGVKNSMKSRHALPVITKSSLSKACFFKEQYVDFLMESTRNISSPAIQKTMSMDESRINPLLLSSDDAKLMFKEKWHTNKDNFYIGAREQNKEQSISYVTKDKSQTLIDICPPTIQIPLKTIQAENEQHEQCNIKITLEEYLLDGSQDKDNSKNPKDNSIKTFEANTKSCSVPYSKERKNSPILWFNITVCFAPGADTVLRIYDNSDPDTLVRDFFSRHNISAMDDTVKRMSNTISNLKKAKQETFV
ncbi:hypothetical protein G6F17_004892 [Rhizopus arrhizus]|nr:hypothetical protein G6F24_003365 [Rhizopus arrhizus]KAG0814466.1 hypothetical protein G6F20_004751 [Rhizopus arrhizus]KAG0843691.1 hypothetical protein G6F19_000350 [Rhizopus arrhizus]KAG0856091.1 hypothetical protein G6F17_004892 [Rhizopus arrhizus]KAG0881916.1 hypothetical protein G6F15_007311 [Rhizopus arrhizus]